MTTAEDQTTTESLVTLTKTLGGVRVLLVGDIMVDENLIGDIFRISPEAPVPVLDVRRTEARLGGVGNTAANVRALGSSALVIGLVGADAGADVVSELFRSASIETAFVRDPSRPTTRKMRLLARGQQIARADIESRSFAHTEYEGALCREIQNRVAEADVLVISDYAKGAITPTVAQWAITAARKQNIPSIVDPKHRDLGVYRNATLLTPNVHELEAAAGNAFSSTEDMLRFAHDQARYTNSHILLTRGADGMTLIGVDAPTIHIPALGRDVFDVTGAGDTVVACMALALARRVPWDSAMRLASYAAGVVVSKRGTATVTQEEIVESVRAVGRR